MKRIITLTTVLILSVGLFAQEKEHAKIAETIDKYIQEVIETWQLPGAAAAFYLDGEVILSKGYGVKKQSLTESCRITILPVIWISCRSNLIS